MPFSVVELFQKKEGDTVRKTAFFYARGFVGCLLGAGFVTGRELRDMFMTDGEGGLRWYALSVLMTGAFSVAAAVTANIRGRADPDAMLFEDNEFLRRISAIIRLMTLVGLLTVMVSAMGELVNTLAGVSPWVGCVLLSVCMLAVSFAGRQGIGSAFCLCVPSLAVLSVATLFMTVQGSVEYPEADGGSPIVSCLLYAGYNFLASLDNTCATGAYAREKRSLGVGYVGGAVLMAVMGVMIMLCVARGGGMYSPLPMVRVCFGVNRYWGMLYCALLVAALIGTCGQWLISAGDGVSQQVGANPRLAKMTVAALSLGLSLAGLDGVVAVIYPLLGSLGLIYALATAFCLVNCQKRERTGKCGKLFVKNHQKSAVKT